MISFVLSANQTTITVCVTPKCPLPPMMQIHFTHDCNSDIEAQLLIHNLRDALGETMQEIRTVSYRRGYRHAKSKLKKATWFATLDHVQDWEQKDAGRR